jgi:hypothetical protein
MKDLTTKEGVRAHMSESSDRQDWNRRCDEVKRANGNDYPPFWHAEIVLSGLCDATISNGSRITIGALTQEPTQ